MKNHHCQECDLKGYKLADTVGIGLYAKLVVCPSCFHKCPLCFGKGYQKKEYEEKREILSFVLTVCQSKKKYLFLIKPKCLLALGKLLCTQIIPIMLWQQRKESHSLKKGRLKREFFFGLADS